MPGEEMKRGWIALAVVLVAGWAAAADTGAVRRVWVWSDAHIGLNNDTSRDRDGAEWLQAAAQDVRGRVGPVAWVLSLGDIANASQRAEYEQYAAIRTRSGLGPWFEIPGNHDYAGVKTGLWKNCVGSPRRFILADGNGVWICFGVERGGAGGKIAESTLAWLRGAIASNQTHNVIVCSHQALGHTVARSGASKNCLYCPMDGDPEPEGEGENKEEGSIPAIKRVEKVVADLRVDLWLCGHIHGTSYGAGNSVRRGRTTFINIASITPSYGRHESGSFVLEFREGARAVTARRRNHSTGTTDKAFDTVVEFPYPWHFTGPPKIEGRPVVEE